MKHFEIEEFNCKCCGVQHMDALFLSQIENARDCAGTPFTIVSGFRCATHNEAVGSTSKNHTSGKAADIACLNGPDRIKIVHGLIRAGFRRIGIGRTFIHADSMNEVESIWLYT
ncbi:MAG: D-Ala-D-Ala carboxypeptidase family metallohydrolase [Calditrichota bacterium]